MKQLVVVALAACSFSTSVPGTPGDGDADAIDAPLEAIDSAPTPAGCKAVAIEAMSAQVCVLRSDGEVWCWGRNEDGAIGVPSDQAKCPNGDDCVRLPTKVTVPAGTVQLGMGDRHTCAMSATKMYCWGDNSNGQLGDNSTNNATAPREIALRNGSTIARGGDLHTCAIKGTAVHCSGRNEFGEIGDASTTQRETPTAAGLAGAPSTIGAGFHHTCAIVGGVVSCWGENTSGQVDTSGNTPITSPRATTVASAAAVAGGVAHTCARLVTGAIQCWGANNAGQLGVGNTNPQSGPQLLGLTQVSQVVAGSDHTCALVGTGVWCWGEGYTSAPTQKNFGGMGALAVAAGSYSDCAIMMDGTVRCWGSNAYGQLGDGSTTTSATPVQAVVCP